MKAYLMAAAAAVAFGVAARAAPPPASAFGRIPAVVDAAISPNGQRVAILGGMSDQRVVSIATIDQPNLPVLPLGDIEAVRLRWAGDDYAIATIAYWRDAGPRLTYRIERHVAISPEAKAVSTFFDNVTSTQYLVGGQPLLGVVDGPQARVLVSDLVDSSGALGTQDTRIKRKGVENVSVRAIWSIDPKTGKGRMLERGDPDTETWSVDLSGEARARWDVDELTHRAALFGRAKGKSQWTQLWAEGPGVTGIEYLGYSEPDDSVLYVEGGKLLKKHLADGAVETLAEGAGAYGVIWDAQRNAAAGILTGAERPAVQWLDTEVGAAHGVLARAFKGKHVDLAGWSKDRTKFIARVAGPAAPGVWYLYDRARKEVSPLGEEYPELKDTQLGTTRWITYKARDGLEIPAYVTLPPGAAPGAKLPLVVLPHGGPAARDTFDFDFLAQFIATRGYAVLQPQFRGSDGFGPSFRDAGRGEWGGKMQTDLLDGIAALANAGDVDPSRVCIVGASFGGYAALAGAALHPESYRCAASIAGIADLGQFLVDEGRLYGRESHAAEAWKVLLNDAPRALVDSTSPARHADAIKAPILLIHGDRDTVVLPSQSQLMVDRLKAAGKAYDFVLLEGENHYLTKAATRTRALEAIEQFLAKNLPLN